MSAKPPKNALSWVTIKAGSNQTIAVDAKKLYDSGCAAVRREFGSSQAPLPRMTLVLGAQKDEADWPTREIRLRKWDRNLFAQGVVALAFEELMTTQRQQEIAKRAVSWAESSIDATDLVKRSVEGADR